MKKILFLTLLILLTTTLAQAASSVVQDKPLYRNGVREYRVTWTADESDGSFTSVTIEGWTLENPAGVCGHLLFAVTNPGATAPTANYDITLTDAFGTDIMGNTLANRSTAVTEQATPLIGDSYGPRFVCEDLTLAISGNSEPSATGEIVLYVID